MLKPPKYVKIDGRWASYRSTKASEKQWYIEYIEPDHFIKVCGKLYWCGEHGIFPYEMEKDNELVFANLVK